jgi:hypothetical protein
MSSGINGSNEFVLIEAIRRVQTGSAPVVPVRPVGVLSSCPIHTMIR